MYTLIFANRMFYLINFTCWEYRLTKTKHLSNCYPSNKFDAHFVTHTHDVAFCQSQVRLLTVRDLSQCSNGQESSLAKYYYSTEFNPYSVPQTYSLWPEMVVSNSRLVSRRQNKKKKNDFFLYHKWNTKSSTLKRTWSHFKRYSSAHLS